MELMKTRIKYVADIFGRIGFRGYTQQDLVDEGEGAITLSPSNFHDMKMDYSHLSYLSWSKYRESPEIQIHNGDILFVKTGSTYGKSCYVTDLPMESTINPQLIVFKNIRVNSKLFFYILQTSFIKDQSECAVVGGTIPTMSQKEIGNFVIEIPRKTKDQTMISKFLDRRCSEINALSANIQSQIDTLEQYKKSVITEAVTKGLDKNAEMKETESQYWKTIPVRWDIVDIKYLFEIVKRIAGKEGYDILSITQHGIKVKDISSNEGQLANDYSNYQFLYPGEFAMNHMDLLTGWVDLSDKFGVTSPDYRVFRLRDTARNSRKYYKYVMQTCYMDKIFYSLGQGVSNLGRWRLQASAFNNFKVPVPSKAEQDSIADYLDKKCSEIDTIIQEKQSQLSTLDSYKKSLIYEYVTGKKEVLVMEG